jgi:hypothetical protein
MSEEDVKTNVKEADVKEPEKKDRNRDWQYKRVLVYVFPETRTHLKDFKGEDTFDEAIKKLLAFAEKHKKEYNEA